MEGEDEEVLVSLSSVLAWIRTEIRWEGLEVQSRAGVKAPLAVATGALLTDCGKLIIIAGFNKEMQEDMALYFSSSIQIEPVVLIY